MGATIVEADKLKSIKELFAEFLQLGKHLGENATLLWMDAIEFWTSTNKKRITTQRKVRLLRAAVLLAAAAFEAWTNFVAENVVQVRAVAGRGLTEAELDVLCERRKVIRDGTIKEEKARYSSADRFLLLFQILNGNRGLPKKLRTQLKSAFDTRNELVHPKPGKFADVLESGRGSVVIGTFLAADIELAKVWVKTKEVMPRPVTVDNHPHQG